MVTRKKVVTCPNHGCQRKFAVTAHSGWPVIRCPKCRTTIDSPFTEDDIHEAALSPSGGERSCGSNEELGDEFTHSDEDEIHEEALSHSSGERCYGSNEELCAELTHSDKAAQRLFNFTQSLMSMDEAAKAKTNQPQHGAAWLMLLGTAVKAPDYFIGETCARDPTTGGDLLPFESLEWGSDFLTAHLVAIRRRLGEGDCEGQVRNVVVFVNLVLPEIASVLRASEGYKAATALVLNSAIASLLGRDFCVLPPDKLPAALREALGSEKDRAIRNHIRAVAYHGWTAEALGLLDRGTDPNTTDEKGTPVLYVAAHQGHAEVVELLLSRGANVHRTNRYGNTPLHTSAEKGFREVVALLLANGADANAASRGGETPLHCAAAWGHVDVVEVLLEAGANVNARGVLGGTPLHSAISTPKGQVNAKVVGRLLEWGTDVSIKDNMGMTPQMLAKGLGEIEAMIARKAVDES